VTHTMPEIVPSLLSADFTKLAEEIRAVELAGAHRLHLDVMDGHFVPNLTIGPFIVKAIRKITKLHLETHLMIERPERFIMPFIEAGSDTVIVHVETSRDPLADLARIHGAGAKAGLVLNPPTPLAALEPYLSQADHLLVMTVNPGFGGQEMIFSTLEKVSQARVLSPDLLIEVDGGVNLQTVPRVVAAGTDLLVAGYAVFGAGNPKLAMQNLTRKITGE